MKRAFLIILFCLCFAAPFSHGAANIIIESPEIENTTVKINGKTPYANALVMITVTKSGCTVRDLEDVYFSGQVKSNYAGEFNVQFLMNENDRKTKEPLLSGVFTVWASSTDSAMTKLDFEYVHPNGKEIAISKINEVRTSVSELESFLQNESYLFALRAMGCRIDEYIAFSSELKNKFCEVITLYSEDFTEETCKNVFNSTVSVIEVNNCDTEESFIEILDTLEITLNFDNVLYENEEQDKKEFFVKLALKNTGENKFTSLNDIEKLYCEAMSLYKLNNISYLSMYDEVLEPYAEILGLTANTDYIFLKNSDTAVRDIVTRQMKLQKDTFESVDELKSVLSSAVSYYKSIQNQPVISGGSSGGSSGGGGGSSKGSSSIIPIVKENVPQKENINDNKDDIEFTDIRNVEWAEDAIKTLALKGVISGVGDNLFEPNRAVTRAEFLKMLLSALELTDNNADCDFDDVEKKAWYYPYVATAQSIGITSGIGDNKFGVNELITRQEMAVFIHRAAIRAYIPVTDKSGDIFDDEDDIATWAKRSVTLMRGAGIINGVGENSFAPLNNATRAEAAKVIHGLYQYM